MSLNITTSILPVGFLLVYQYTTKYKKNFYVYTIVLSAVFAFVFATIEEWFGLIEFHKGANKFHLFLVDLVVVFISYWFTLFIKRCKDNARMEK
jgi:amino acid permease